MISPVDITSVKSPVLTEAATLAPSAAVASVTVSLAQGSPGNLTQAAIGQLFQAQVLSKLEDGTYLVNVANNALRMALPAGTNVGSTVQMTLLATEPRPAFLLESQNDSTSASLSSAAKVITTALQSAQQAGAPTALIGKAPLLPTPTSNSPQIGAAMQGGIEFSGLFYESHVNQWANGERPLSDLMREPQAQEQARVQAEESNQTQGPTTAGKPQVNNAGTWLQRPITTPAELTRLIANVRATPDGRAEMRANTGQALDAILNPRALPQEADTIVRSPILTQETAHTINLQLNTLEQHRIEWHGELWPGQQLEWEINEDTPRQKQHGDAGQSEASWQSVVRFNLPKLGKITASIHLADGHVQARVSTASVDSASTLKAHGDELANALDSAGSPLDLLIIKQDDHA